MEIAGIKPQWTTIHATRRPQLPARLDKTTTKRLSSLSFPALTAHNMYSPPHLHSLFTAPCSSLPDDSVIALHFPEDADTNPPPPPPPPPPATDVAAPDKSLEVRKKAVDLCPQLKGTSIFLVGTSCPIKTSIGKVLADALAYYFFDSDEVVVEAFGGESIVNSAMENDETGFRESETEVLKQLSAMGRLVVCAGDGAVQSSTNLGLLRYGITLWIDVPLEIIAKGMVGSQHEAPTSERESESQLSKVLTELLANYQKLRGGYGTADATISLLKVAGKLGYDLLDSVTAEDMALEILMEIEKLTRVKKMMEEAGRPF